MALGGRATLANSHTTTNHQGKYLTFDKTYIWHRERFRLGLLPVWASGKHWSVELKYGNRSTETKVQKWKEKLSMSSRASLGRLLNKAVSLLTLNLSSQYTSPFVPCYHKRRTKLYPHVLHETYCILSDTSNLDCIVQNTRVTHVEDVLHSPCLHGCMHRLGLVLCMLYMQCKGETTGWEAK